MYIIHVHDTCMCMYMILVYVYNTCTRTVYDNV